MNGSTLGHISNYIGGTMVCTNEEFIFNCIDRSVDSSILGCNDVCGVGKVDDVKDG